MTETTKRLAVVTGANKGIGLEIIRQLALNGVVVILTARDEKRGLQAAENLKGSGLSDIIFHQLNVGNPDSVASMASFIKTQFGKLDILGDDDIQVNNAGIIGGAISDADAFRAAAALGASGTEAMKPNWKEILTETYELAKECLNINYYGTKRVTEALLPLLQLSDSPRIVNVSSSMGKLKIIPGEWAKQMLSNVDSLTEDRVDEVLNEYLKDFKEDRLETKGWPTTMSAYIVSKAAMSAYTRIIAKKFPNFCVNCICPGYVKTDINCNTGFFTVEEGAKGPVMLALLPDGGPSGQFYFQTELSNFDS